MKKLFFQRMIGLALMTRVAARIEYKKSFMVQKRFTFRRPAIVKKGICSDFLVEHRKTRSENLKKKKNKCSPSVQKKGNFSTLRHVWVAYFVTLIFNYCSSELAVIQMAFNDYENFCFHSIRYTLLCIAEIRGRFFQRKQIVKLPIWRKEGRN